MQRSHQHGAGAESEVEDNEVCRYIFNGDVAHFSAGTTEVGYRSQARNRPDATTHREFRTED